MNLKGFRYLYRETGMEIKEGKGHQTGLTPCTIK